MFIRQAMLGLEHVWPQIIVVLCICWIEIKFTRQKAQFYSELHKQHTQYLTESSAIKSALITRLMNEIERIEQKTPPPVG